MVFVAQSYLGKTSSPVGMARVADLDQHIFVLVLSSPLEEKSRTLYTFTWSELKASSKPIASYDDAYCLAFSS
jgi:hypothetical protein